MEPNKLETQFKTKLNSREIKPSNSAWDRLDVLLTVSEKPKRNLNWMYIAASFFGFIFIANIFFSQTENVSDKEKVVFEKEKNIKNEKDLKNLPVGMQVEKKLKNENQIVQHSIINQETNQKNQLIQNSIVTRELRSNWRSNQKTNQKNTTNQKNLNQLVKNEIVNQKTEQKPIILESNKELQKIVAINTLDKNDEAILDNLTSKQIEYSKISIKPNDLLSQVDGELELTFREKVIQSVSKNFKSVKVALENRNK